jgi:predicted RNA-binding protein with PUA-like domain
MPREKRYWLLKCEPAAYTIDDLERDGSTTWEGVRNYQARNSMRDDMKIGDGVLFYASNAEPSGVAGVAEISREGYPDPFAFEKGHHYFDPDSDPTNPTWYMVEIRFVEKFPGIIPLGALKATPGLEKMVVTQKGSRLSVQPVTPQEFEIVVGLGRSGEAVVAPAPAKPVKKAPAKKKPIKKKVAKKAAKKPAKKAAARKAPAKKAKT